MSANEIAQMPRPESAFGGLLMPMVVTLIGGAAYGAWQLYTMWLNTLPPEMLSDPSWFFLCH
ncbi:MAG: hypothetical protein HC822_07735 [Oscillochloris sp.]|nr:hypothetical protein [Oscillochloris sp.]